MARTKETSRKSKPLGKKKVAKSSGSSGVKKARRTAATTSAARTNMTTNRATGLASSFDKATDQLLKLQDTYLNGGLTLEMYDRMAKPLEAITSKGQDAPLAAPNAHFAETKGGKAEAMKLIDPALMVCRELELTHADLQYHGREETMKLIDTHLGTILKSNKDRRTLLGKGQPIIATGATTGVGKSRLLHEVRRVYQAKGYHVVVVSYNTDANLSPHPEEQSSDRDRVISAFYSRMLSMMLPAEEFEQCRLTLYKRFKVLPEDVLDVMAQKFAGSNVLILMDDVGALHMAENVHPEIAMNMVISALGDLAEKLSRKLQASGHFCAAIFTALSEGVVAKARTNFGRSILTLPLPLLSQGAVSLIVSGKYPQADNAVVDQIFAMSAGHSLTVANFLELDWDETRPKTVLTIESLVYKLCGSVAAPLNEKEVRAILLGTPTDGINFEELSNRSLVYVSAETTVRTVPAFLYMWASSKTQGNSRLALHVKRCLEAAWHDLFLTSAKQGTDGRAFERFMWHYEAVRRELLQGESMTVPEFYNFNVIPDYYKKKKRDQRLFQFPFITIAETVANPRGNSYSNFIARKVCKNERTRYETASSSFPKYDCFALMKAHGSGQEVVKGELLKHGAGPAQDADPNVVSVKVSTHDVGLTPWEDKGWLVLRPRELARYLGPTFASAGACFMFEPKKRQREE